jgi:hypothetical protein
MALIDQGIRYIIMDTMTILKDIMYMSYCLRYGVTLFKVCD